MRYLPVRAPWLWAIAVASVILFARDGSTEALRGHGGPVKGVAVGADDAGSALTTGFDYSLILWDLEDERIERRLFGHDAAVNAAAILPSGDRAISASDDGTLALWDLQAGKLTRRLRGHEAKVVDVALDPAGRRAASASWDRTARVWDLINGRPPQVIEAPANLNAILFSKDGRRILAGDAEGSLLVWRLADGRRVMTSKQHDFAITALALDPSGGTIATASIDETVELADSETGEVVQTLFGHDGPVLAVDFSPDGELVASGGLDGSVRVWRRGDGDRLRVFLRHRGPVWSVAFTDDGRTLLSGGADGLVVSHDLDRPEDEVALAPASPALSEPVADGSRGARLFKTCEACHTLTPDGGNRAGPTLYGLFGRRAGALPGYPYSQALKASELVWTEETVSRLFEVGPETLTPGSKMPLQRMPDAADRAALVTWLKEVTRRPHPSASAGDTGEEDQRTR